MNQTDNIIEIRNLKKHFVLSDSLLQEVERERRWEEFWLQGVIVALILGFAINQSLNGMLGSQSLDVAVSIAAGMVCGVVWMFITKLTARPFDRALVRLLGVLSRVFSGILRREVSLIPKSVVVRAVDGVDFNIRRGEVFGLAGESGSGKTTIGRMVLRLEEITSGEILMDGINLAGLNSEELRRQRRRMQIIFQDPFASLNPRMTLGEAILHNVKLHLLPSINRETLKQGREIVEGMMERVGLAPPSNFYDKYPHQISGGQRQRAVIARALVTSPELVIADEPIAMADVSVRSLLLDLMIRLKNELQLTYLFITHDLATAKYICDRIGVMYLGKMAEIGNLRDVYDNPAHPYTQALLDAVPIPDPTIRRSKELPKGEIPNPINPPSGCRFHPRCPIAQDICSQEVPEMLPVNGNVEHLAACHLRTGEYKHLDSTRNAG